MTSSVALLLFFAVVLILGGAILLAIIMRSGDHALDKEKFRSQWLAIESSLKKDQEASYHLAVLNADKLLDTALRQSGVKGTTMGERLKFGGQRLSQRDAVWAAHKLRNQIAHEPDVKVNYMAARRALASFKQALKDVGAI